MKSFVFFIVCGKRAYQMHSVKGLERLYTNCNGDKFITSKFEAKILSSISRYSKAPTPIEYKNHAKRYRLHANIITENESGRTTHRFRLDNLPIQTPRSAEKSVSTQRLDAIETNLEAVMDKMTMVVGAVTELQVQIDNTENMQNKIAEIMDMESQRVQNLEQKMENVGTTSSASTLEHFDVILDRLDYLELKIEEPPDQSHFCSQNEYRTLESRVASLEASNRTQLPALDPPRTRNRASVQVPNSSLSTSLRSNTDPNTIIIAMAEKIKQLEAQLAIQQTLNVTWQQNIDQMNEKLTKLTTVCQNLNARIKHH
jgi:chromosome segregation ATPase